MKPSRPIFLSQDLALGIACCLLACGCNRSVQTPVKAPDFGRSGAALLLVPHAGTAPIDAEIRRQQELLRVGRTPTLTLEQLGWLFVAKARESFDPGFYTLAEQCALGIEARQPTSPEALLLRGHVFHALHRFREAETLVLGLVAQRGLSFDYGLLGDILSDVGRLKEAAAAYQRMLDLKPDPRGYARAAHIRWLKGDLTGALDLMRMAARGASPRDPEPAAPNNQGNATPYYNQDDNGEHPAKDGVATEAALDRYTQEAVTDLANGYRAFAGQRDDGFYGDIQSIFDLLTLRSPGKDAQGGFNIHLMALEMPVSELGGDHQIVGVYATTSRQQVTVLRDDSNQTNGKWTQVARQGNPLFNEVLVALADKDLYSRTSPSQDSNLFRKYALTPELAHLINALVLHGSVAPEDNRTDIAGIFIPDLIKVDLSTPKVRLAGGGPSHPTNPDDPGFSRMSIFGNDVLQSQVQDPFGNGGFIPGGWPNGRRFGDDVVDIAVSALISDLRGPLVIRVADGVDGVSQNDMAYNKVFPYESTPQNGRNHSHP